MQNELWIERNRGNVTVLFPKFLTRQFRYAELPTSAVTFFDAEISKYGPRFNALRSAASSLSASGVKPLLSLS